MEQSIKKKEFQAVIKGLHVLFTFLFVMLCLSMVVFIGLSIVVGVIPAESVMNVMEKGQLSATLHISGLEIALNQSAIQNFVYDKSTVLWIFILSLFNITMVTFIVFLVKNMLKGIVKGEVFSVANSKRMAYIGYTIVVLSLTIHSMQAYVIYAISTLFQLQLQFEQTDWIESVNYQIFGIHWSMLLCGLVVWTISRIFKYGSFLQEEYDATV
ncbi:DUF2975 domain-containing protein [Lysinibacillus sp. KU-BSD001]|uniref:DUF2975 domain-containing protein n=1 Tax=Lysinibacillus sp. KU-BSD001 TaxID=3141328 RepID=UPI0036EAAA71